MPATTSCAATTSSCAATTTSCAAQVKVGAVPLAELLALADAGLAERLARYPAPAEEAAPPAAADLRERNIKWYNHSLSPQGACGTEGWEGGGCKHQPKLNHNQRNRAEHRKRR